MKKSLNSLFALISRPAAAPIALDGPGRPKADIPADQLPPSEAELTEGLEAAYSQRQAARITLESAASRREALLAEPDSDAALDQLDLEITVASRTLERLDAIEDELRQKIRVIRDRTASDSFQAFATEYQVALEDFLNTFSDAIERRETLQKIRRDALAQGHQRAQFELELPSLTFALSNENVNAFRVSIASYRAGPRIPAAATYPVKFTQSAGLFNAGEVAAFPDNEATAYVKQGFAVWADPVNRPKASKRK